MKDIICTIVGFIACFVVMVVLARWAKGKSWTFRHTFLALECAAIALVMVICFALRANGMRASDVWDVAGGLYFTAIMGWGAGYDVRSPRE